MATIDQEFAEVRTLLGHPKEQRPSPHMIIAALIRRAQFEMNKLGNTSRGWSVATAPAYVRTIANQNDYTLTTSLAGSTAMTGFGKALFVYRDLGNNVIAPVKFTDYVNRLDNQGYDFVSVPVVSGERAVGGVLGQTIAFYRNSDGTPKARIYPTPEAVTDYTIVFAKGSIDWSTFVWTTEMHLPEWSQYRCLNVAMDLIDQTEWPGYDRADNQTLQDRRAKNLMRMIEEQRPEFESFLNDPHGGPSIGRIGSWY